MVNPTYGKGTDTNNYTPNIVEELDSIGKIAMQIIREIDTADPLAVFDKQPIDKGDTIEQAVIKLVESSGYDFEGKDALTRDKAVKMAVRYFKNWTRAVFKQTVDLVEVREILESGKNTDEVASRLVSTLGRSDIYEKYTNVKGLLKFGSTADSTGAYPMVNLGSIEKVNNSTDYKGLLKKLKDTLKGMTFVNTDFNVVGIKRSANINDLMVIMPYKLKNATDVDELTGVFNLDKAEISKRILEIDSDDNIVYVVDKNAILVFTKLYEMANQKNGSGLFYNYFLHVERMYAISPLFNAAFFEVK